MKFLLLYSLFFLANISENTCKANWPPVHHVRPGAYYINNYKLDLKNKRIALLINQTSEINGTLLLDTFLKEGINVVKVFVPEHGFRGTADAGAHIKSDIDKQTGLPIISLYGNNKKPSDEQLKNVDVVVYDLQDVGVRFYTYISTLEYMMEACAKNKKQLIILDRPNPNGHYVDGPVLQKSQKSFVGMQPIPVVYGMTAGEYAQMLAGEKWIEYAADLNMKVITCRDYEHGTAYFNKLPVPPSPNLKTMEAIFTYPSLCFFEGTVVSVGRGTDKPFEQWGHPSFKGERNYFFIPQSKIGASKPLYEGQKCYGMATSMGARSATICLDFLLDAYKWYPDKQNFFNNFFEKLAGTTALRKQIEAGKTEEEIRASWQRDIAAFKKIRKKYLLYKDFE